MLWQKQEDIEHERYGAEGHIKDEVDPKYGSVPAAQSAQNEKGGNKDAIICTQPDNDFFTVR